MVAYCLNPNHYHILLKQLIDGGIGKFMRKLGTGYTKYFNLKYNRSGVLFQGRTKSVNIKTNEQLLYVAGYINTNAEIHGIARADDYIWSSQRDYLDRRKGTLCKKDIVINQFRTSTLGYKRFISMVKENAKERKEMFKYYLENLN